MAKEDTNFPQDENLSEQRPSLSKVWERMSLKIFLNYNPNTISAKVFFKLSPKTITIHPLNTSLQTFT